MLAEYVAKIVAGFFPMQSIKRRNKPILAVAVLMLLSCLGVVPAVWVRFVFYDTMLGDK